MHSIGSAHAEVRSRRRETSLASTTDRILLIIGAPLVAAFLRFGDNAAVEARHARLNNGFAFSTTS